MSEKNDKQSKAFMEKLSSLCKRRGFIFQSSEIYGGINGFWDYGPLGCELKRNIKEAWWNSVVRERDDVEGLDATIIMHPRIWEASGHVQGFQDPMQTCRHCRAHLRADQVWEGIRASKWFESLAELAAPEPDTRLVFVDTQTLLKWACSKGQRLAPGMALVRNPQVTLSWLSELAAQNAPERLRLPFDQFLQYLATEQYAQTGLVTPCPNCGGPLTEPRKFNLMFKTHTGPLEDDSTLTYLRPETAQGIFVNFPSVLATSRQKIPFGIAQIGKAFRNEINPRNFTFRSREFEQMELEFFIKPGTDAQWHEYWVKERLTWYESIGLSSAHLHQYVYPKEELAHYASACVDITYDFPFGNQELEGIAARGNYDLSRHQEFSGKSMEYFDPETNEKFIPHVVEPSAGVDRIALALLCEAYDEDTAPDEKGKEENRVVLRFAPRIAPIKVAVLPLLKNRPELVAKARGIYDALRKRWSAFYDQSGAIGRRYRRQDEAGTPYCVTIDFQTLEDDTVTLRDRDTMKQERVAAAELPAKLAETLG